MPVERVSINQPTAEMEIGETIQLNTTVSPSNATHKEVTWSSSKKTVASVSENGLVTAIAEGSTTIYATADGKTAECAITVSKGFVEVSSISLNKEALSLIEGDSEALVATVKPDDATDKTITWSSSDSSIATVDNGKVSAIKEGTTTITAKAGHKQALCAVTVTPKVVHVEGVALNETSIEIGAGSTFELIATVYPESATNKDIKWTSSNDNVATVDAGIVKGISPGEATIKATTIDGGFDAICNVKIIIPEFKGLTFTASGNVSVGLQKSGSPGAITLEYSKNGFEWQEYSVGDYIELSDGEILMFRAGANKNERFSIDQFNYYQFIFNGDGEIIASGNVMSLLDREYNVPLTDNVFRYLFRGCQKLILAPELPTTSLTIGCYSYMFQNCTSLTTAPALPATALASGCYSHMFYGCSSLASAPSLPATILADYCYSNMFYGCSSLASAPSLPATTLTEHCYSGMFAGCSSLTTAPELPATHLENYCYQSMFSSCLSLVSAPALPATELAYYCYSNMFNDCSSLLSAPVLPATILIGSCYQSMFSECSSLANAPELPATVLANSCYRNMFSGCTSLTTAPELPASTLESSCYDGMFSRCKGLIYAPTLPATTLVFGCYTAMFEYCSNLAYVKALFKTAPGVTYTNNWLYGVYKTGTFVKASNATWDVTGASGIPSGWTVQTE